MAELVKCWTHWKNEREKRIFLVVDSPINEQGVVVTMEVKQYGNEEERSFQRIAYTDWIVLTEEKKLLKEFIPTIS